MSNDPHTSVSCHRSLLKFLRRCGQRWFMRIYIRYFVPVTIIWANKTKALVRGKCLAADFQRICMGELYENVNTANGISPMKCVIFSAFRGVLAFNCSTFCRNTRCIFDFCYFSKLMQSLIKKNIFIFSHITEKIFSMNILKLNHSSDINIWIIITITKPLILTIKILFKFRTNMFTRKFGIHNTHRSWKQKEILELFNPNSNRLYDYP